MGVKTFMSKLAPAASTTGKQQIFVFDTLAEAFDGTDSGDIAVFVDTLEIRIWNGTRWANNGGGLTGQKVLTDNVATTFATITCPTTLTAVGGIVDYMVIALDADDMQIEAGSFPFTIYNIAGTLAVDAVLNATDISTKLSSGTNAVSFTITASGTTASLKATADTSLTITPASGFLVKYTVRTVNGTGAPPVIAAG